MVKKTVLLVLPLWIVLYIGIAGFIFQRAMQNRLQFHLFDSEIFITVHLISMMISLIMLIVYMVHLWNNKRVRNKSNIGWTLALLFLSPVSQLYYWWKFIK